MVVLVFSIFFSLLYCQPTDVFAAAAIARRQQMQQAQQQAQQQAIAQAVAQQQQQIQMAQQQAIAQQILLQVQQQRQIAINVQRTQYIDAQQAAIQAAVAQQYQQAVVEQAIKQKIVLDAAQMARVQQLAQARAEAAAIQQAQQMQAGKMVAENRPFEPVSSDQVKDVVDIADVWRKLDIDSRCWTLLIDNQAKVATVSEYIDRFAKIGAKIRNPPIEYVHLIDEMAMQNPSLLMSPFKDVLQLVAVMQYDFDNGMDKDALAKKMLGEQLYLANKKRLGR